MISFEEGNFVSESVGISVTDVCAVILAVDITKGISKQEIELIDKYHKNSIPVVVALTKIDLVEDKVVFETLAKNAHLTEKCEIVPVSSLKHKNVSTVVDVVKNFLPVVDESQRYFEEDMYTDKPLRFIVAEVIREKALYYLDKEIPHGIAVSVWAFEEEENIINIEADIVCDKDSHKAIILGKQGSMLKKIGHSARVSIQKIVQKKVNLNIFIKVKPNWKNNLEFLSSLGYNINEI